MADVAPEPRPSLAHTSTRLARVLAIGFALHLKMMTRSSFDDTSADRATAGS